MDDWQHDLGATLDQVWARLARGVADRKAPARHPVLASMGLRGFAEARTVVLRAARRGEARLELHTDRRSSKVAELAAAPGASLHVWDAAARLQMRLRVRVEVLTGEAAAAAWEKVPAQARLQYGGAPPPGEAIAAPSGHAPAADPAAFAVLACHVAEIETLHLGDPHARALFGAGDGWRGRWLAP